MPHSQLLILDLDETLIHASFELLERPPDFTVGEDHVYKRPHVDRFLAEVSEWFELAVWTAGTRDYAQAVLQRLLPQDVSLAFFWTSERCALRRAPETWETIWLKDLKKVQRQGYALERVLMVEDTPANLPRQYGNVIPITPYLGNPMDRELVLLARYLRTLHGLENVRRIEKRGWQARTLAQMQGEEAMWPP